MRKYPDMKSSSVKWIGEIPAHWQVLRNKYLLIERDEKTETGDEELLSLSQYTGISIRGQKTEKIGMHEAESLVGYKIVYQNDIVMNIMLAWNGSTAKSNYDGIISPAYAIYHVISDKVNPDYLHYLYKTPTFMRYFEIFSTGIIKSRLRLYSQSFLHLSTIVPSCEEQDQIVRFLDWKVSEINRLINIKRKEIERLEELKNHTITKCVTKGLDNAVQFKYSGTDWIGEIPEHWVTIQLRRAFSVILGKMLAPAPSSDSDTHEEYVCAKDVHFDGVDLTSLKKMWFSPSEKKQYEIKSGDLLIVEGGAGAGNAALVPELNGQSIYVQNSIHIVRAKSNQALNKFLCYWIGSLVKRGYMKNICSVATIPHFTKDKVLSTVMPLAPIEEQIEIVAFLDKKCQEIDELISFKEQQIQALHEFKTRLISDVVTGKIDVRGIEIPEYEYTAEEADTDSEAEAEELDEEEE